jgi:ABC-type dipeptide/oligopeptide/nickel transport system ATPase subunit
MKKTTFLLALLVLFAGNLSFSANASDLQRFQGLQGNIDIAGGTAHIPVMNEAAKRIMTQFPDIQISVAGGGTGIGVQKAGEMLTEVRLWNEVKDRLKDNALTLSGGQQQRLCLARGLALAMEPEVLLPDEPTASLDFKATRKIEELFLELKPRYTILAVTHSIHQMRRLADRVLVMNQGRVIKDLDSDLIKDQDACERLFDDLF